MFSSWCTCEQWTHDHDNSLSRQLTLSHICLNLKICQKFLKVNGSWLTSEMVVHCGQRPSQSAADSAKEMPSQTKIKIGQDKPEHCQAAPMHIIVQIGKPITSLWSVHGVRFGPICLHSHCIRTLSVIPISMVKYTLLCLKRVICKSLMFCRLLRWTGERPTSRLDDDGWKANQ